MDTLMVLALSPYVGEKCTHCSHIFNSVEDLKKRNIVCAFKSKTIMLWACKKCYDAKCVEDEA